MGRKATTDPRERLAEVGLSFDKITENIRSWYYRATDEQVVEGLKWYDVAGGHADAIAEQNGITREHAAVVISHLSPRTSWERNVAGAYALVATGEAEGCIGDNVERALAGLASDTPLDTFGPRAKKTERFAHNILGDRERVTVDIWAARAAWMEVYPEAEKPLKRVGVYEAAELAYRTVAEEVGMAPAELQAVVWVTIKAALDHKRV